jgi:hypothetical protein
MMFVRSVAELGRQPSDPSADLAPDLPALGDFLADITVFLLVWIFIHDRRVADRAQVDQLAAWIEGFRLRATARRGAFYVNVNVHFHNESHQRIRMSKERG